MPNNLKNAQSKAYKRITMKKLDHLYLFQPVQASPWKYCQQNERKTNIYENHNKPQRSYCTLTTNARVKSATTSTETTTTTIIKNKGDYSARLEISL